MDFKIDTDPVIKTAYTIESKVAGGSVTLANMRLSLAVGFAFVDFSAAGLLTPYALPGAKLVLIDSSGNKATGYIKQAGTGETYTELNSDTGFDNPSAWTITSGWSVSGGAAVGDGTGGGSGSYIIQYQAPVGALVVWQWDVVTLTAGSVGPRGTGFIGALESAIGTYTAKRCTEGTATGLYSAGFGGTCDNLSLKRILTPSPTGVTIVSAAGGATRNWASIDAAFNYNSAAGYTYEIYAPAYTEVYIPGATILSQNDVVDQRGQMTFDKSDNGNLMNNIYLSLLVRRGSFFQNPNLGSRLHLLHRAKNTAHTEALAAEYCKEALQWLIDNGRAVKIDVYTERDRTVDLHRLKLLVEATKADGQAVSFTTFVEVI